jgi:hypothetical protein
VGNLPHIGRLSKLFFRGKDFFSGFVEGRASAPSVACLVLAEAGRAFVKERTATVWVQLLANWAPESANSGANSSPHVCRWEAFDANSAWGVANFEITL